MSQGPFLRTFYRQVLDTSQIHRIVVQPETVSELTIEGIDNDPPAGPQNNPLRAKVSKTRREIGLKPYTVRFVWTDTAPPGYLQTGVLELPLLDNNIRADAQIDSTGSYLGVDIRVIGFGRENEG